MSNIVLENLKERLKRAFEDRTYEVRETRRVELMKVLNKHDASLLLDLSPSHYVEILELLIPWEAEDRPKQMTQAPEVGPVRTVTKREIVPGRYGSVDVSRAGDEVGVYMTGMITHAELTAAIATLTEIRDAMEPSTLGKVGTI